METQTVQNECFSCQICDSICKTKPDLDIHTQKYHANTEKDNFEEKTILVKDIANEILRKREESGWNFKCKICSAKFEDKEGITKHNKAVHGGKKFIPTENGGLKCTWVLECTKCLIEFSSKPKLIEHSKSVHKIKIL